MEKLFNNSHSEIPEELWKVASPIERQLAAVEYWAQLRGVEKIASKKNLKKRLIDFLADERTPALLTAGSGVGIGAGLNLYSTRKIPQDKEIEVARGNFTRDPTREQLNLRAERAAMNERKERGEVGPTTEKIQDIKERLAAIKAQNRALSTLAAGTGVGLVGYGLARRARAMM